MQCEAWTYDSKSWDADEKAWFREVLPALAGGPDEGGCRIVNRHLDPGVLFLYEANTGNMVIDREQVAYSSAWHVVPTKLRQERSGGLLQSVVLHLVTHSMGVTHAEPEQL